jgi:hypothetical protein
MGYKIYTHEIKSSYAARVDNFRSYDAVSKDIIQRWTYPMVPDVLSFGNCHEMKLHRQGIYKASGMLTERIIPRFISASLIHSSLDEFIKSIGLIWNEERLLILIDSKIKMLS